MAKKAYKLEDFFTNTLAETPAKMPLLHGKVDTGQYLFVLGSNSPKLKRPIIKYRNDYSKVLEESKSIEDKIDRELFIAEKTEELDLELASAMTSGTSFSESDKEQAIKILSENTGLSNSVIAFSFDNEKYLAKK